MNATPSAPPEPDEPVSFGYKCAWLAIRADSARAVAEALDLEDLRPSGWSDGLDAAYSGQLFVTPPLRGWVFAVSTSLPDCGDENRPDAVSPLLARLGERFPEVQYFATHRVVEFHAWARVVEGRTLRKLAWVGDQGFVAWDEGEPTGEERALGIAHTRRSIEAGKAPREADVMAIAGSWSLDPSTLEEQALPPGLGLLGTLPGRRPEHAPANGTPAVRRPPLVLVAALFAALLVARALWCG
jgi:hypothetical protein